MTHHLPAVRVLLARAIDYAGLFPPASLSMREAVSACATYRKGADAWALGRFVVPAARLGEMAGAVRDLGEGSDTWRVSALVDSPQALRALETTPLEWAPLLVDAAEAKAQTPTEVHELSEARPAGVALFVEVTVGSALDANLAALRETGVAAKLRTGGVVPDAFPSADDVVRFLRGCIVHDLPFKLTAGLHHPVRGSYPLTYQPGSASGMMYGYLNVFFAATHLLRGGSDRDALEILLQEDRAAASFDAGGGGGVRWGRFVFTGGDLQRLRSYLPGFGSCSFREPLDDLAALGVGT